MLHDLQKTSNFSTSNFGQSKDMYFRIVKKAIDFIRLETQHVYINNKTAQNNRNHDLMVGKYVALH